jgi:hypothetical protein
MDFFLLDRFLYVAIIPYISSLCNPQGGIFPAIILYFPFQQNTKPDAMMPVCCQTNSHNAVDALLNSVMLCARISWNHGVQL